MFPSIGNLTEGKIPGTLSIPIFGQKKKDNHEKKQIARKQKNRKFRTKIPSIRTAHIL